VLAAMQSIHAVGPYYTILGHSRNAITLFRYIYIHMYICVYIYISALAYLFIELTELAL
jgi:hypothetical protein